jgi:hypothetical protein
MRLFGQRTRVSPALLLLSALGCALGALSQVVAAQPWSPLVRESRTGVITDVLLEAQSVREIDPGVFEIRLMYEPVAWACVRRGQDGECDDYPDRLLLSKRIAIIRIRCRDTSFEEVAMWVGDAFGNWRQLPLMEFRHPPGWRYDIATSTAVSAAHHLVCATVPR